MVILGVWVFRMSEVPLYGQVARRDNTQFLTAHSSLNFRLEGKKEDFTGAVVGEMCQCSCSNLISQKRVVVPRRARI